MENKGKRKKITSFEKKALTKHFTAHSPVSDVLGSYTGVPIVQGTNEIADEEPVQDADDL